MKQQILNILKKCGKFIISHVDVMTMLLIIATLIIYIGCNNSSIKGGNTIIGHDDSTHTTTVVTYDKEFKDLKKENKQLYDSLKQYKDEIDFLIQYDYSKKYNSGDVKTNAKDKKVYTQDNNGELNELSDSTYVYTNDKNDTLNYKLSITSKTEPKSYNVQVAVNDKFTITNKSRENLNETTVTTNGDAQISNVTVYQKSNKKKFWQRFAYGPQVSAGYDVVNRNFGVQVGFGVTFDISKK